MKKISLVLVLVMLLSVIGFGCSNGNVDQPQDEPQDEGETKDTLVIGSGFDIDGMDPHGTGSLVSMKIVTNIYDTLFKVDPEGNISQQLVENWEESEDKLTYTFKLKEGVMFHNGEELKASDAVFSIRRGMESPYAGAIFMSVEGAEEVSEYEFKVNLKYPYAPFLYAMATPLSSILNEKAVNDGGDDYSRNPIGTAAYKFVSWEPGDRVVLEANNNWHMGEVPIKNLIFRVLPDLSTAAISLENEEIDLLLDVSTTDRQRIQDNPDLELIESPSHQYIYLGFNMELEMFQDINIRQAVAYAIDKEGINEVATEGVGTVAQNHLTSSIFGFSPDVKGYEQDMEKAKDLISQSSYPDGFECNVILRDEETKKAAQVIKSNLAEIGIEMNVETLERAAHLERGKNGDFDMILSSWSSPVPDADYSLNFLFHSKMINAMNLSRYSNPEIDELILEGEMQLEEEVRLDIYEEILETLKNDLPTIPLYYKTSTIAANNDLQNVKASPSSTYYFYELSWE
ncbi:MAG: ABC transporter substrate-binding protein [Bacillota bacterium]|nr:ABC transporter substrate-binding protein [Bacillota bacterium]